MCSLCVGCNLHLYTMRGFVAQVSLLGRTSQCNVTSIVLFCAPLCVTFLFFISCTMYIYISLINFLIDCLFVYLPPSSPLHQNSVLPLLANSNIQLRNKPAQSLRATLTFSRPLICLPLIPPPLLLNTFTSSPPQPLLFILTWILLFIFIQLLLLIIAILIPPRQH